MYIYAVFIHDFGSANEHLIVPTVPSAQIQIDGSVPKIGISFNAKAMMSG